MQFGMPTLIEIKSLESCTALCQELGFDFVEFNMDLPDYQIDRLDLDQLSEKAKKYGIYSEYDLKATSAKRWTIYKHTNAYCRYGRFLAVTTVYRVAEGLCAMIY